MPASRPFAAVAGALLAASAVLAPPVLAATPFVHEIVQATDMVGDFSSLELDAQGNPHIACFDSPNNDLKYARKVGGIWTIETVASLGSVGLYCSLALDAAGNPHISYYDGANGDLKYVYRSTNFWSVETVDAAGSVGMYTSLALDAQGNPRISYRDASNQNLKYASKSGGSWTIETVDAPGDVGTFTSLALDAEGNPRIGYMDISNFDVKYASKYGGFWTIEVVDNGNVGSFVSLALDASGNPHISYFDGNGSGGIKFARKSDGFWTLETVVVVDAGLYSSLALDAAGTPHIAYLDNSNADLEYATLSGGIWKFETVDAAGFVGSYCSIALDALGNPHISYFDGSHASLKYARRYGGTWARETVASQFNAGLGYFSSLALDPLGNPRIAHYDLDHGDLKYTSAAIELGQPAPGVTWPVGASRTVTWDGTGRVDVSLSVDGGRTWDVLGAGVTGGAYGLVVPHAPTRFAQVRLERSVPRAQSTTTGLFTIETSISLPSLAVRAAPDGAPGVPVSWRTEPGPEELAGYRLEREDRSAAGGWRTIVALTRLTSHLDAEGGASSRYRLSAVNGLGGALRIGEAAMVPAQPLAAWPLPFRGGALQISFATFGGLGGGMGGAEVDLYDLGGRKVRTLARGSYTSGQQLTTWDGLDDAGRVVGNGVYFLRARTGGTATTLKLAVVR